MGPETGPKTLGFRHLLGFRCVHGLRFLEFRLPSISFRV